MTDSKVIDFAQARSQRVHAIHEQRLEKVRQAFAQALPMTTQTKNRVKNRKKPR